MNKDFPRILVSDKKGKIFDLPDIEAAGMKCGRFFCPDPDEYIKLPSGSELFMLPGKIPIGYKRNSDRFIKIKGLFPVAAFLSPGYTITYNSAYESLKNSKPLPLFSYGAVSLYKGDFYTTAVRVDMEMRQDLRLMDLE